MFFVSLNNIQSFMQKNWLVTNINKKFFLKAGNKIFSCQVGSGGLKNSAQKVEGDKTTPVGKWYLKSVYYRPDKVLRPKFKKKNILNIKQITKHCGWCDDIKSNYYNKHIKINNLISKDTNYEKLWRKDEVYDIIIIISYNIKPTIKNKGSAIFIHCSFHDYRHTAGCIALNKKDLLYLIKNIKETTSIKFL